MTFIATILLGGRAWLWPAAIGLIVLGILIWRAYQAAPVERPTRITAALLKAVALTLLAIFLIEPMWAGMRVKPGANVFVVLADNSQSLSIADGRDEPPRGDALRNLARDEHNAWIGRLAEQFDVRRYVFDTRVRAADAFDDLSFDGRASRLLGALRDVKDRLHGRSVAGVIVLTDGNATDVPQTGALDLDGLPPIYPVVIGSDRAGRDLGIANVAVTQTSFEDAPVSVRGEVSHHGYDGMAAVAQLVDDAGKVVQSQTLDPPLNGAPMAFDFQVKPTGKGVSFYTLRVAAKDDIEKLGNAATHDSTSRIDEATLANNTRQVMVDRGRGPFRVLYFSGRPNWEYKFLHRALLDDDQLMLTGLIRIAKKEPKFVFRGRNGEQTNPLFRGTDTKDEDTERFDEAVFIRLDTLDANELRTGFPSTPEELFKFHAIVFDDLEREALTRDELALVERFVADRGGGLLMLGGAETFQNGDYDHTVIARMLPVYLDRAADAPTSRVRLSLTREGWLQPWVRLRKTEDEERSRLTNMPGFVTFNALRGIKPGASVLAEVKDEHNTTWPALVAQRFGRGRVGALTIGDLWRWQLKEIDDTNDKVIDEKTRDQPKAWRQMIRWLVADVPQRVDVEVRPRVEHPDAPLDVTVRVRDAAFRPLDNAHVTVNVKTPDGQAIELTADASLDEPGLYTTTYLPRAAGAYRAAVLVRDAAGAEVAKVDTGWSADPAGDEYRSVEPNRALLADLAQRTGGQVISPDDLASLVADLPNRQAQVMEQAVTPLWHHWWMLALALGCLVGEWALRRLKGLP